MVDFMAPMVRASASISVMKERTASGWSNFSARIAAASRVKGRAGAKQGGKGKSECQGDQHHGDRDQQALIADPVNLGQQLRLRSRHRQIERRPRFGEQGDQRLPGAPSSLYWEQPEGGLRFGSADARQHGPAELVNLRCALRLNCWPGILRGVGIGQHLATIVDQDELSEASAAGRAAAGMAARSLDAGDSMPVGLRRAKVADLMGGEEQIGRGDGHTGAV